MMKDLKLSRRGFIKISGAFAGASALTGCSSGSDDDRYDSTEPWYEEKKHSCACLNNCANGCRLFAHVRNGRIVKMSMAPMPDERYSRVCLRGLTHMQRMYNPNRVLYPMKRMPGTERGKRENFVRISWEQAVSEITEKFQNIMNDPNLDGSRSLAYWATSGNFATVSGLYTSYSKLFNYLGVMSIKSSVDLNVAQGFSIPFGTPGASCLLQNQPSDFEHAKTIILWGTNFGGAHLQSWHHVANARDNNGAEIISVDIMLSNSAARADKNIFLRPGSDTFLALYMIKHIIDNGWIDKGFMFKNTVANLLVNSATGRFLKKSDITGSMEDTGFVAWKNNAPEYTTAHLTLPGKTVLSGDYTDYTFDHNIVIDAKGDATIQAKTAYQMLIDFVNNTNRINDTILIEKTGVDPSVAKALAERYATHTPSTIASGFGPDHRSNGHHIYHALSILAAITGNIGKPGAGVGVCEVMTPYMSSTQGAASNGKKTIGIPYPIFPQVFNGPDINGGNEQTSMDHFGYSVTMQPFGGSMEKFMGTPARIRGVFIAYTNIITNFCETRNAIGPDGIFTKKNPDGSYKMNTIVVAETEWTDTAVYADYVLPACHWFERHEDYNGFGSHPFAVYQEDIPGINPMGESLPDIEIARKFANAFGCGGEYSMTNAELFENSLSGYDAWFTKMTGRQPAEHEKVTPEKLRSEKVIRAIPGMEVTTTSGTSTEYIYPMYRNGDDDLLFEGYNGTGRIEFYSNILIPFSDMGQSLPGYGIMADPNILKNEMLPEPEVPYEAWHEDNGYNNSMRAKGYTLSNFSQRIRWRVHTQWWDIPWLRELEPYPIIYLNPKDAATNNIQTGDIIEVFNDRGSYRGKAILTPGLQPGVIDAPRGWQRWQYDEHYGEKAGYAKSSKAIINDAGACNDVVNIKTHPASGCAAFFEALVAVKKITKA